MKKRFGPFTFMQIVCHTYKAPRETLWEKVFTNVVLIREKTDPKRARQYLVLVIGPLLYLMYERMNDVTCSLSFSCRKR